MKKNQTIEQRVKSRPEFSRPQPSTFNAQLAFTLIELLVVISIIAILAAFTLPALQSVKRRQFISHTQAELALLETAIDSYKAAYGFYPPDSTNTLNNIPISQLYYELLGTTNDGVKYTTLDGSAQPIPVASVSAAFGPSVSGFINCNSTNKFGGEDSPAAKNFLPNLKPKQFGPVTNQLSNVPMTILLASVGGPDLSYQPLNALDLNPWRYNSSHPTNNPGAYDLWVELKISGKTNLVCNWSKQIDTSGRLP